MNNQQENLIGLTFKVETILKNNYLRIYLNEECYSQFAIEYILDSLNISVNKVVIIIKYVSLFQFMQQNLILDMIIKAPKLHSIFILDNEINEFKERNIFRVGSVNEIDIMLNDLEKKNSFENQKLNKYGVPIIIQELLKYYNNNMSHEGLFRKCAVNTEIHQLMDEIRNYNFTRVRDSNPHLVACTLKLYLGQLDSPLINTEQIFKKEFNPFDIINDMSEMNARVFYMIISFLQEIAKFEEQNKMNAKSLGILIAPSLVKFPSESQNPLELMNNAIMFMQKFLDNFHRLIPHFHYEDLLENEEVEIENEMKQLDLRQEWKKINKVKQHII